MIDNLSILLSHALLLFMFYHVIYRDDLDEEAPPPKINLDADPARYRPVRTVSKTRDDTAKPHKNAQARYRSPVTKAQAKAKAKAKAKDHRDA